MATCPDGHASDATDYCDVCGMSMAAAPTPASAAPAAPPSPAPPAPAAAGAGEGRTSCPDCQAGRTGRFCEECGYDFAVEVSGAVRMAQQSAQTPRLGAAPARPIPGTSGDSRHSRQIPASGYPLPTAQPPQGAGAQPQTGTGAHPPHTSGPQAPPETGSYAATGAYTPSWTGAAARPAAESGPAGGWEAVVVADRAYYESVIAQGGPDAPRVAFPPYCPERRFPVRGGQVRIGRYSRSRNLTPEIDLSGPPEDPGVSHLHAVLLAQPDGSWTLVDPGSANGTTVNDSPVPLAQNVPVPVGDGDRIRLGAWTVITLRKG
ncbi:hypothetical protein Misp01_46910 [Microtetraspora sp. NBRC 13810]|uniref:FHA domain-containing protein n=1 Tax=Microtetraspora sp. NBRC 13810 TaxID=3030990 RepID=UPI0024A248AE|nr:FHA domain-containing protein [Microtetraspora sp. NBRC 13810]GLW09562.1 hypothetical protein Misp01_46910 [Microtetraspora sp. NBRC 13810]